MPAVPPSSLSPLPSPAPASPLLARLGDADRIDDGLHQLIEALIAHGHAQQVWVGLLDDAQRLRLLAAAPLQLAALPQDLEQPLRGAMQEAMEQALPLAWPPAAPAAGDSGHSLDTVAPGPPRLAIATDNAHPNALDAVTLEHRLLQARWSQPVATLPLGVRGQPLLAITLSRGEPYARHELDGLVQQLHGVAGSVRWMQRAAWPWHRRLRDQIARQLTHLRQPDARWRRRGLVAAALGALLLGVVPVDDTVRGSARIEGEQQRILAAPADGFVKVAHARPGDMVKAGAPLLDLVDADLRLDRERWLAQASQQENAYAASMAKSDRVGAATAMARLSEAQAQLALVDEQLARGRLVAPFDALVIQGDWSQSAGAPVRQGDPLLTLATRGRARVVIEVDEVDIARVAPGQAGSVSLSAWAWRDLPVVVERVAPMARAVNGKNVFEVQARLLEASEALRPGLVGRGTVAAGQAPWLWSTLRGALLRMRTTLWRWWG